MKNKTRKNKKIKGGASCPICGSNLRKTKNSTVSLCGKEQCRICTECALDSCKTSAAPPYKYDNDDNTAENPKCPLCRGDAKKQCKELTGQQDLNKIVDWNEVPYYDEWFYNLPQVDLGPANPNAIANVNANVNANVDVDVDVDGNHGNDQGSDDEDAWERALDEMPDTSDMQIEPTEDLLFHLEVGEIVRLDYIIGIIDQCLREGILISIFDEIQIHNGAITIATLQDKIRENPKKYDAEDINAKWLRRVSNASNYIAMLKELSIEINTRLRRHSSGAFSDIDIEAIKENMLMYIFNSTMISVRINQEEYLSYMLHQIYTSPPFSSQEVEGYYMILLTILEKVQRNIDQIVTQIFTATPSSGGKKKRKSKRRTVKSGTKLRGTKKKESKAGGNDISIDLDSMNKKLQNNLLSRGNNKHWSKNNLDSITKANIKDYMKTLNSQKKREERKKSKKLNHSKKSKK